MPLQTTVFLFSFLLNEIDKQQIRARFQPLSVYKRKEINPCLSNNVLVDTMFSFFLLFLFICYSRGDRNQELVESSEEDVARITDPDVSSGAHDQQHDRLQRRDTADDQLRPDVPTDFSEARHEGGDCACRERAKKIKKI